MFGVTPTISRLGVRGLVFLPRSVVRSRAYNNWGSKSWLDIGVLFPNLENHKKTVGHLGVRNGPKYIFDEKCSNEWGIKNRRRTPKTLTIW